ncbi:MAG: SNF2-related protein, partial [Actinomycetia bacterium]|nr:SNF2-related protein [Actinomycetes bacterium]
TLRLATNYDRLVGYWRSSSLVVAAAGLTHFLHNAQEHGGRMRIIAGAGLTDQDIAAIDDGEPLDSVVVARLLEEPDTAEDVVTQQRLRLLAWMVKEGFLEIKIGVPLDPEGKPLLPAEADRLFHTKFGILTDATGDRVVFEGSVNESAKGWQYNHEAFTVFPSWKPDIWDLYGQPWVDTFEQHWETPDEIEGWEIFDFPEAVEKKLLERIPASEDWTPPIRELVEDQPELVGVRTLARRELVRLRDAPMERGGTGVGFVTLPIEPWPHQDAIASRILETWPRSYLLADEVGLGKTIEAGLVIRELLLTKRASKILLLVPASVQRQWQEEMWEKFCLDIPSLEGGRFFDAHRDIKPVPPGTNPWSAFPVVLASSHLARMRSRRRQINAAGPWDLVFVDEAHHARRRGSGATEGANQLLQLLREMKKEESWEALLLATATPMQMATAEVFDLLDLLGLPGAWASSPETFEAYYRQLAEPDPKSRDWALLRGMSADYFKQPAEPNQTALNQVRRDLPGPDRLFVEKFHDMKLSGAQVALRPSETQHLLDGWLRANTPLRDRVYRTSREALREYQRQGILSTEQTIPRRHVDDRMIDFGTEAEEKLYQRIEDYISRYYEAYSKDKKTKPLGFIMTVYRRRLTSSLYAVYKSLERRRDALQMQASMDEMLDDDDRYTLENSVTFDLEDLTGVAQDYGAEIAELTSFLDDLAVNIPTDTKVQALIDDIQQSFFAGHKTVVVFTQFTDTLNWLRDELKGTYGEQIACYTGDGGSRWNAETQTWQKLPKEKVKELFRAGKDVKILLGTDAMSEGLNLQTTDRLINYDMPWNFMRVEQRIGRIDRIGGRPDIYVTNYFYRGTVEEQVYTGIKEDAEWFEQVVGPAQPVLGQVEAVIEDVAMRRAGAVRDQAIQQEIEQVRHDIDAAQRRVLTISDLENADVDGGYAAAPAITLVQMEQILTDNSLTKERMHPHPDFDHTYYVEVGGEKHPMTFDRDAYDRNPEIGFMTYQQPIFDAFLNEVRFVHTTAPA